MFSGRKVAGEKRGKVISAGGSDFCCCFSDLSPGVTSEVHAIPLSVDKIWTAACKKSLKV